MQRWVISIAMIGHLMASAAQAQDRGQLLIAAAEAGRSAEAGELVRSGAPVDARDASGRTPLLSAVDRNALAMARMLMNAGASLNAQAANRDTPWLLAGARGRAEMLREMIPLGPDLSI
ncbi:MAG: ankyrin repeat domain-containing protein, partial [Beijerinckiaceae bacterium]